MTSKTSKRTTGRESEDEHPYARYAFWNPYNVSLFLGGVVLGVATDHGFITVLTCAAEVMWMIFAPDSKLLRAIWFDRAFQTAKRADEADHRAERIAMLAQQDATRLAYLCGQKRMIEQLARENPSLTVELLHGELEKLDRLLDDFIELGVTAARAEQHTTTFDFASMRRSWHIYEELLRRHPIGDARREVATKNMDVLRQRRARYDDLCRAIQVTRGQMELIEQTFRLLGDEIMSMASPQDLGVRIDELRIAVDAVRETADERLSFEEEATPPEEEEKQRHVS